MVTFGVRMQADARPGRWSGRTRRLKRGAGTPFRKLQSIKFLLTRDRVAVRRFLTARYPLHLGYRDKIDLLRRFTHITNHVRGYHSLAEILTVCDAIFRRADGRALVVVEAGAGSGSSTAKLSIATQLAGGRLIAFDSFQGIPDNDELHHLRDGRPLRFNARAFRGRLAAVEKRIATYGAPEVVELRKGLFADTLPALDGHVDVGLLDVDLVSSTRTCVEQLMPRLAPGGVLFSQDGHIRETIELLEDTEFWRDTLGVPPPQIGYHCGDKLVELTPSVR